MSLPRVAGVSGWEQINPLFPQFPDEIHATAKKCESPIEQMFLYALYALYVVIRAKMLPPRPVIDAQVCIGKYRADIVVNEHNGKPWLVIECDGEGYHNDHMKDQKRTMEIQRHGYKVLRATGSEIYHNPIAKAAELLRLAGIK